MKNIVLVVCFSFYALLSNAQISAIDIARIEFKKGNYKDAVGLFNGAIANIADAETKRNLINEKEKSSNCWQNIELADRYFKEFKFAIAQRYYGIILSNNPSDSYAKHQKDKCIKNIENARLLALEKKKAEALLVELISSNDINGLKAFIKNYATYENTNYIKRVLDYYDNPKTIENSNAFTKQTAYIEFGNIYYKHNKAVAALFYEKAAACGSLVGFYKLAISLPQKEEDRAKRLLIMAAVNGQGDAAKLLGSKYPNLKYNKEIPKTLHQYLVIANDGHLASAVVIQSNRSMIGLPNLSLIDETSDYVNIKDRWEYELGMMFLEGEYVQRNLNKAFYYLSDAASKGNYTAQYELAKMMKDKNETYYYAFILCAAINGNSDAQALVSTDMRYVKAYAQYLSNKKCDYFSTYMFLQYHAYKYKIEDINAKLVAQACYQYLDRKSLREVNKLIKSKINWNEQTISKIQSTLANSSNKYHKKLLKQLSKIKVVNIEVKPTYFQSLVKNGYCSTPYPAYKRTAITDFMSNTYSSSAVKSNTTANSTNRSTTNTKPEEKKSDINYRISPRSNMSINEAQSWCKRLGAGWWLASASELKNIPGLYGTYWTNGGIRGVLVDSHNNFRSRSSDNPNDRAGAVAIRK